MGCGTSRAPVVARPKPEGKESERIREDSAEQQSGTKESKQENEYIDTEEFISLSYEEVAALRPTNPENMWAIVKKSSDKNREWKLDSVKNRRGWKTIRLFVSSTFRDFHAEREALVKEVSLNF